ncbi:MAG: hypothetical protein FJ121_00570 [Deltaproteobacteria bacterium]|nr:hypothetical protein [Deltaproteobacteria bacterium]
MNKNAMLEVAIENLDMERAVGVAQRYVLKEIYLVDAKITRDPLIAFPDTLSLEHKCDTSLWYEKDKPLIDKIHCNFQVAAFSAESPDKLVMKIEASFCTSYVYQAPAVPDDFEVGPDDLEYFFRINPISHAWPYWREFVQSMSSRMGFPALTVPLLEIVLKKTPAKKVENQPVKKESPRRKKVNT